MLFTILFLYIYLFVVSVNSTGVMSTSFETKPLRYSDACPFLPVNRPRGYPHLIDTRDFDEDTDQADLRAADGVVTLLYKWKPEELDKFFDMTMSKYELT